MAKKAVAKPTTGKDTTPPAPPEETTKTRAAKTPRHPDADAYAREAIAKLPPQPTQQEIRLAFIVGKKHIKDRIAHNRFAVQDDRVSVCLDSLVGASEEIMLTCPTKDAFVAGGTLCLPIETE